MTKKQKEEAALTAVLSRVRARAGTAEDEYSVRVAEDVLAATGKNCLGLAAALVKLMVARELQRTDTGPLARRKDW